MAKKAIHQAMGMCMSMMRTEDCRIMRLLTV